MNGFERRRAREHDHHAQLAEIGTVPEAVRRAAREAFETRPTAAQIADLVFDSLVDEPPGTRPLDARLLRFECRALAVDVAVQDEGDDVLLETSVSPPAHVVIDVQQPDRRHPPRTGPDGRVALGPIQHGLVSLHVAVAAPAEPSNVQTAWVRL